MTSEVRLDRIRKSYSGTPVLHDVSLTFAGGRIHGLVGENGAGKSTLLRVLCGHTAPSGGRLLMDGRPVRLRGPRDALAAGISLVPQESVLVPALTVLDNVFLGRRGRPDRDAYVALARRAGMRLDPGAAVRGLSFADRKWVEILRALARRLRILALDEPTALLSEAETGRLLELMRSLAADGVAVVFVSHLLDQVLSACDVVTVLRDGREVSTGPASNESPRSLVRQMAGRPVDVLYPAPSPVPPDAPVLLSVRDLRGPGLTAATNLDVRAGEIVGLAGLVGSGRSETLRLIFGAERRRSGSVTVADRAVRPGSPRRAMAAGLAMVPESRHEQGLVLVRPVRENLALATLASRQRAGLVRAATEARETAETIDRLDIRGSRAGASGPVHNLSGGNQQKTLFGKWLLSRPKVLLVDEPTRGVDVAAKVELHRLLISLARSGMAIVMVSSEIDEVIGLCHRVLVMRDGRVAAAFDRGAVSREAVLAAAFTGLSDPASRLLRWDPDSPWGDGAADG